MDDFGQLTGAPGAAAELAQDAPGLELGIGVFTGGAQPGMCAVGLLLGGGLVPARYGVAMVSSPRWPLSPSGTRPQAASSRMMPQIRPRSGHARCRAAARTPTHDVTVGADDDLQVHPVLAALSGVEGPVGGDPVDGD